MERYPWKTSRTECLHNLVYQERRGHRGTLVPHSNTNIVGILFLYKTSWYTGLRVLLGAPLCGASSYLKGGFTGTVGSNSHRGTLVPHSNTNIVGILFLYKTSWYTGLRVLLGAPLCGASSYLKGGFTP